MPRGASESNSDAKGARQRMLVPDALPSYQMRRAEHDGVSVFQCATIRKDITDLFNKLGGALNASVN
jgi:hypothetical protein